MPSDDPRRQLATEIAMLAARELLARLPEAEGMMKESDQVDVSVGVKFRRDKPFQRALELINKKTPSSAVRFYPTNESAGDRMSLAAQRLPGEFAFLDIFGVLPQPDGGQDQRQHG